MILIAAIGTGRYGEADYYRVAEPARSHRTRYGPVAAAALHEGVQEALLLMTPEAEQAHGVALTAELERLGIHSQKLSIPVGRTEREIWEMVRLLMERVPNDADVVVDVTHALRHIPVLFLSALTFLTGERKVRVRAIVYGAYEVRDGDRVPMFDLRPFFTLMEYYHAVRQFRETGDARRLAEHLKRLNEELWKQDEGSRDLSALAQSLSDVGESLMSGLPLETGLHSRRAAIHLQTALSHISPQYPIGATLMQLTRPVLEDYKLRQDVTTKADIVLDLTELQREWKIIRSALEAKNYDRVLLLLREWLISRCVLAVGPHRWLDYPSCRRQIEKALNGLVERVRVNRDSASVLQRDLCGVWSKVVELRNALAHAGMRPEEVELRKKAHNIEQALQWCEEHCELDSAWRLDTAPPGERLLITPLGLSPGVLLTALKPLSDQAGNRALVVTSEEASRKVPEICKQAGWDPLHLSIEIVRDPHRGFDDVQGIVKRWQAKLAGCSEVTVNVTGGTTALQYIVDRLGREAERLGLPVRWIALIDDRPLEQQQREPYVEGQVYELEAPVSFVQGS